MWSYGPVVFSRPYTIPGARLADLRGTLLGMGDQESGRIALVTGGAVRVGRTIVEALVDDGFDVLIHYAASAEEAREAREHFLSRGARVELCRADLADRTAVGGLAARARRFGGGKLDLLVHNAANFERVAPDALEAGAWDRAMALNATAPYLLTLALAPELRAARGSVVAIGCLSAERPYKHYIPYSISKAALVSAMQGLSLALAPDVRVNVVSPGTVLPPEGIDDERRERIRRKIPLGRIGEPSDVARAVLFFAKNHFVTGQVLAVDGGRSIV